MENLNFSNNLIHPLEKNDDKMPINKFLFFLVGVLFFGGLLGFGLSKINLITSKKVKISNTTSKKTVGIKDKKTFRDTAEGILREGGIDGEGNFHLERPGGSSQNVYLTSSTVDLSQFIGKRVKVWGETFAGQKAGWLMDVGLVEVID